jgi:hypothetical protein
MVDTASIHPGTRISKVLKKFGIKPNRGCSCYKLAQEMNRVGVDVVMEKLDYYTDKMLESIKEWRKSQNGFTIVVAQPPRAVVRSFIEWACS